MPKNGFSQSETSRIKALIAVGINSPSKSGFVNGFEAKSANFPTINLGVQYMFKPQYGVKLDYGYNRIGGDDIFNGEFKTNYSRINAQFVYDFSRVITFLPPDLGFVAHAGPGLSFVKPLGNYKPNKENYFNVMAGLEIHKRLSKTLSAFVDTSYIFGKSKDFDNPLEGYGAFRGNMLTITVGVAVSLRGCYTCPE